MNIATGILIFVLIWWLVIFTVLPWGVRGQYEAGDVTEGTEPGAPQFSNMKKKLIITTAITAGLWLVIFVLVQAGILTGDTLLALPGPTG